MKRYFFILTAIMFAAVFFISPGSRASSNNQSREAILFEQNKMTGDFDKMVKHRTIRALVVPSKTFYFIDKGKQYGLSYEALREFEKYINRKLNRKTLQVHVVFIPVTRDKLIPSLVNGLGDIAVANLTRTPERKKYVDFSNPFFSGVNELLVTSKNAPPVKNMDDLSGKDIHVRRSSSYYESLVRLNTEFSRRGKPKMTLHPADETFEDEDLLEMVNADLIPMIVVDSHKAEFWGTIFDNINIRHDIAVRTNGNIAWAFRKNSPQFKAMVNEFVRGHKKGRKLGNILFKRYLVNNTYVKNPTSEKELAKYNEMVEIFKTYSGRYDFDYLMIMAQAYQESGLDHAKKSHVGAVGVMQLLPSTAADPNVNIADIKKLENNIHAGVKYLRFIIDRYYKDEPMDDTNKLLFAFASYNAGPAKINKIRNRSIQMGIDPNIWFRHVENAAARSIGRETVHYVRNIYKYYIAYQMVAKKQEKNRQVKKSLTN